MNYHTISDLVAENVEGSLVSAAFFSTFSFEPDFFELEIMPLLLAQKSEQGQETYQPALSTNDAIRWQQLERLMTQRHIDTSVVYDPVVYRCERSPRLEIAYHSYSPRKGCQHAKLIAMVLESPSEEVSEKEVLFGAGSFNLTRAGWWDNIECGHFVKLNQDWAPDNLCTSIIEALTFYQQTTDHRDISLEKIIAAIKALPKSADEEKLEFYFGTGDKSFSDFISRQSNYTGLEVISPYFSESGDNNEIRQFLDQFESRRILLPIDPRDDSRAKLSEDIYRDLEASGVQWCDWRNEVTNKLKEKDIPRELHAKVYRMSAKESVDLFIGSVNFSYKAFKENIEAGFLVRDCGQDKFLTDNSISASFFDDTQADKHGDIANEQGGLPVLNLSYCWKEKKLILNSALYWQHPIRLLNNADEVLALFEEASNGKPTQITTVVERIEQHLKNTSLVIATSVDDEQQELRRELILSQQNVFARPSVLPPLSLADLLGIFRGMSASKILQITEHYAKLSEMALMYSSNEDVSDQLQSESQNFFSEFSEINSAFYHLNMTLCQARREDDQRTLDYYLLGKQPDSLHGALHLLSFEVEKSKEIDPVIRYLSLVSILGTLELLEECSSDLANLVRVQISQIEASNQLRLTGEHDDPNYDAKFFSWFKREFLKSTQVETKGEQT